MMQEKKLEYIQYKLDYEEHKKKWDRKMATDAGDHLDRLKELQIYETKSIKDLAELELKNSRLVKENSVLREYFMNNKYQINIEKIEEMIKRSEKELFELTLADDALGELRESLHLKRSEVERGHKFENMKLLQEFYSSGKHSLLQYKAIEKIKADLKEE